MTRHSDSGDSDPGRRLAAILALLLLLGIVAVAVAAALDSFPRGLVATGLALAGVLLLIMGISRRRIARVLLMALGALMVAAAVAVFVWAGLLVELALLVALVAAIAACVRQVFRPAPRGLRPAARPSRPVLIYNPKSGGGKAERFKLADEAAARGIEAIELHPGDDLVALVRDAVDRGADALGAAGGDGTQALVAMIAAEHDLPFACIPAGTRNHFALDLGVDRDDVVGALDAFVAGLERHVDLAEVNGRVFVNNVSLGVYASAVQSEDYRGAKLATLLDTAPDVVGPEAQHDVTFSWTAPDGTRHGSTAVLLISNNPYRLVGLMGTGTRPRLDTGRLGIVATRDRTARAAKPWTAWEGEDLVVEADAPVAVGVDGEALRMEAPLVFRGRPGVLRVRIAPQHPGASPSSGAPTTMSDAIRRLFVVAMGTRA